MYLPDEADRRTRDLAPYLLSRTASVLQRSWQARLREHGVTIGRWQVLTVLAEYDGSRLGQIARLTATEQSATTRVVDQMERDGLVTRRRPGEDGRAVEVWLTRGGRALHRRLMPHASELVETALAGVADADVDLLADVLTTMLANLGDTEPAQADLLTRSR